jgi:hypothetical protein
MLTGIAGIGPAPDTWEVGDHCCEAAKFGALQAVLEFIVLALDKLA